MNLTSFLKQINEVTAGYTKEQLCGFIREIARVIPESRRDEYLSKLRSLAEDKPQRPTGIQSMIDDKKVFETIIKTLELIDSGEVYLDEIPNEEYSDWNNDDEEDFYYEDGSGIAGMLEKACDYVHQCAYTENYSNGFEVGSRLLSITVCATGEFGYDSSLSLQDMMDYDLLKRNETKIVYDTLYCGYMGLRNDSNRVREMYDVIRNSQCRDITLEGLMQHSDIELPDIDGFLDEWTDYLGRQKGRIAEALFNESVRLMNEPHRACELADKYMDEHPGLYLQILNKPDGLTQKEIVQIGYEALGKIPTKYVVRSRTALKTAEYILKEESPDARKLEECYLAAYESNTTPLNYLRALLNGHDGPEKRKHLNRISSEIEKKSKVHVPHEYNYSDVSAEQYENKADNNTLAMLGFLEGRFRDVMQHHMNTKEALGWSATFMKQGIAVFLLSLYEGEWNMDGIKEMARKVSKAIEFSAESYNESLGHESSGDESQFASIFRSWKSMTPMEDGYKSIVLDKIEKMLEMRTEGIMNANRRNYYGECASYIAALGEVRESLGETGAKQRIMTGYRNRFSRRTSFVSELEAYGWRKRQ